MLLPSFHERLAFQLADVAGSHDKLGKVVVIVPAARPILLKVKGGVVVGPEMVTVKLFPFAICHRE